MRPLLAELVRLPGVERFELAPFSHGRTRGIIWRQSRACRCRREGVDEHPSPASEGNPLYAEQLLASGVEADAEVALPVTLADVLLGRVQALL